MRNEHHGRQGYSDWPHEGRGGDDRSGRQSGSYRGRQQNFRSEHQGHDFPREASRERGRGYSNPQGNQARPRYDALGRYYEEEHSDYPPRGGGYRGGRGSWREQQGGRGARVYGDRDFPEVGEHDYTGMHRQYGGHEGGPSGGQRRAGRHWEEDYDDGGDYGSYPGGYGQRQAQWRPSGKGQGTRYPYQQPQPGGYPGDQEYRVPRMGESGPWQRPGAVEEDSTYGEREHGYGSPYESRYGSRSNQGAGVQRRVSPKGYTRSDARLREDVCERLSHSGLDVSEVSVEVKDGIVSLEGSVEDRWTKHAIEDCADDCLGVQEIDNRIRVMRSQGYSRGETTMRSDEGASSRSSQSTTSPSSSGEAKSSKQSEQGATKSSGDAKRAD